MENLKHTHSNNLKQCLIDALIEAENKKSLTDTEDYYDDRF